MESEDSEGSSNDAIAKAAAPKESSMLILKTETQLGVKWQSYADAVTMALPKKYPPGKSTSLILSIQLSTTDYEATRVAAYRIGQQGYHLIPLTPRCQ